VRADVKSGPLPYFFVIPNEHIFLWSYCIHMQCFLITNNCHNYTLMKQQIVTMHEKEAFHTLTFIHVLHNYFILHFSSIVCCDACINCLYIPAVHSPCWICVSYWHVPKIQSSIGIEKLIKIHVILWFSVVRFALCSWFFRATLSFIVVDISCIVQSCYIEKMKLVDYWIACIPVFI
jgi:hypothetical protein